MATAQDSFGRGESTATSFLTPATNPGASSSGRHSIDFSEKAPQVMEWTSTLTKDTDIPPTSALDQEAPSSSAATPSLQAQHEADLEELYKITPAVVEVPAPDMPAVQDLQMDSNPSFLSTRPPSSLGKNLDGTTYVPSPPSSIIAEPPSPTLSTASLRMGTFSSTSSNVGDDHEQDHETQDMDQDVSSTSVPASEPHSSSSVESASAPIAESPSSPFVVPRREILTKDDLELFHGSQTYASLFEFLDRLNESVVGVVSTANCPQSEVVRGMLEVLDRVNDVTQQYPPETGHESRFGNPAFRKFYDQVVISAPEWMETLQLPKKAIPEVAKYFVECWGNRKRIDYGTGHEASFLAWLYCFDKLGLIKEQDYKAIVIKVFFKYVEVMRSLQFAYWLEPAGSHGVWGLDDYHFLPFLFGAAQLRGHKYIRPKSIHDNDIVSEFSKDYMYLSCVKFINSVKSASLRWHSPMLDDISAVKTWDKVNSGMVKMYKAEVFGKLPIMQHFLFGSILPFTGMSDTRIMDEDEEEAGIEGHQHVHAFGQEFPTCCGMKIPSAIAAAAAAGASGDRTLPGIPSSGARRLPFD
ncbi:Serine/threonine-protein phosphatase 2A activator 2 [Podila humilis]|nr:Serine/threonine-protein phosphatase 2A activator 2 [Podila humilis]